MFSSRFSVAKGDFDRHPLTQRPSIALKAGAAMPSPTPLMTRTANSNPVRSDLAATGTNTEHTNAVIAPNRITLCEIT